MPEFAYTALNLDGLPESGRIHSASADTARQLLTERGLKIQQFEELRSGVADHDQTAADSVRFSRSDEAQLAQHLGSLTQGQLPLVSGLKAIAAECPAGRYRRGLMQLIGQLESGTPLPDAVAAHGTSELAAVLNASQEANAAGLLLKYLDHRQTAQQIRWRLRMMAVYPLVILSAAAVLLLFIFVTLIPAAKEIFRDFGLELPGLTQFVIDISDLLVHDWPAIVIGVPLAAVVIWLFIRALPPQQRRRLAYRVPLYGSIVRATTLSRFVQLLASLTESRTDLPTALRLAGSVVGDPHLQNASQSMAERIERGESFEQAATGLRGAPFGMIAALETAAEPAGSAETLRSLSAWLDNRLRAQASRLAVLLHPLVICGLACVVGTIVIAIFLPLVSLINNLS